jgi:hypothetical protein
VPAGGVRRASVSGGAAAASLPAGLGPVSLRYAYGLEDSALTGGVGQTVAVVTEYGDSTAQSDMAAYRSEYSLPACGSGCFSVVDENGGTNYPPAGPAGWTLATAQSLDLISAVCPNCHILLVEAGTTANGSTTVGITDLGAAENTAVSLGAKFVTNTWFTPEATFGTSEPTYDTDYFNHPGVVITAPDGNGAGYGTYYPAASPDVIAVGGTTLTADSSAARGWTETAWSGSGSGCSPYEAKPSWQTDTGCSTRTLNDVAAVADPTNSPVASYDTSSGGWVEGGGTDVSSALVAAAFALAGTPASGSYPASYLYAHDGAHLVSDITSGSNGTCTPAYLCTAGSGYDGPTGVGTIESATALGAHAPDASLTGGPAAVDPASGSLDIFGTGLQDGTAWGDVWTASGGWGAWQNLGGVLDPVEYSAVYDPASGNIEVYALAPDSHVYEDSSSSGTSWSGWKELGSADWEGIPSAVFNPLTNSVDVWEVATTGTGFVDSWNPATGWSGWKNKSGLFTSGGLTAVYDPVHSAMDVYGVGTENGTAWGTSYTSATGSLSGSGTGAFSGWNNLGGNLTGKLSAIYDPDTANIEVYGQDTSASNDYAEEIESSNPSSGFSSWHYLYNDGPVISAPPFAVYNPRDNSIEVWEADVDQTSFYDSWTPSGGWTAWQNKSGLISSGIDPVYDVNSGDLKAFGVGPSNGTVWEASIAPSGAFSAWANISGILKGGDL